MAEIGQPLITPEMLARWKAAAEPLRWHAINVRNEIGHFERAGAASSLQHAAEWIRAGITLAKGRGIAISEADEAALRHLADEISSWARTEAHRQDEAARKAAKARRAADDAALARDYPEMGFGQRRKP